MKYIYFYGISRIGARGKCHFFYVFNFVSTTLNKCQKCSHKINIDDLNFFSTFLHQHTTQKIYLLDEVDMVHMDTNLTSIFLNHIYMVSFSFLFFQRKTTRTLLIGKHGYIIAFMVFVALKWTRSFLLMPNFDIFIIVSIPIHNFFLFFIPFYSAFVSNCFSFTFAFSVFIFHLTFSFYLFSVLFCFRSEVYAKQKVCLLQIK